MQFVSAIIGMFCWVSIFVICCRYKKTIIGTILASQQLDEWQIIKIVPIKAEAGPTLRPDVQPILTLFPPHEMNGEDAPMSPQHIMSLAFIIIVIVTSVLAFVLTIWKKCRFASSTLRTCFPLYPPSSYDRGICQSDIFVEVTNVANCKTMWAHFKQIAVHPTLLKCVGYLNANNITIYKTCCFKTMRIDWERAGITLYHNKRPIPIPGVGTISIWTSGDLDCINADEQYQIRILGRVLDQIYEIPMDTELMIEVVGGGDYIQYDEQDSPQNLYIAPQKIHHIPD